MEKKESIEQIKRYLDKIVIDLPNIKDVKALEKAKDEHILTNAKDYNYNISTDLAIVTGKNKYGTYAYLKEPSNINENILLYQYENLVIEDDSKDPSRNRYNRNYVIRPVLRFDNFPELFDLLPYEKKDEDGNDLKYSRLNFGYYPRYVVSNSQKLMDNLKITNETYIFDDTYIPGNNSYKKKFKPAKYPVYEYNNHKYIKYRINQITGKNDILDKLVIFSYEENVLLSDKSNYKYKDYVLIEITKIPWIVDIERKVLIAQEGLLSGIQFENYSKKRNPIDYEHSNVKSYLDTFMKYDILHNEELLKKINIKEKDNSKTNEIIKLLNEIKKYNNYYLGNIDIESKVKELLNDYNQKLDELANTIGNKNELSIGKRNPEDLYKKLVIDLENLLFDLKVNGEKVKNYHDMIDILDECKKDYIDSNKDEICNTIKTIKKIISDFIVDKIAREKLIIELDSIIDKNIERNKAYINNYQTDDNKTKSLEELKLEFKCDLQPFLENLNMIVKKQDIVDEMWKNIKEIINNKYTESNNKIISNYSKILNDIIIKIEENGTKKDKNKLMEIFSKLDFNINDDISVIMKIIESVIIQAYKIELDIEERQRINKEIDNLRIDIDVDSILEENNPTK